MRTPTPSDAAHINGKWDPLETMSAHKHYYLNLAIELSLVLLCSGFASKKRRLVHWGLVHVNEFV